MDDESRFLAVLRRAAADAGMAMWTWSAVRGFGRDGMPRQPATSGLAQALSFAGELRDPAVFVFLDAGAALSDPAVVRRIKEFALAEPAGQTVVLTASDVAVPADLEGVALLWTLDPPDAVEVERFVRRLMSELVERGLAVALDDAAVESMTEAVRGITLPEAERLILREAMAEGGLDREDIADIREAKADLLADDGVLELVPTDELGLDSVGGMETLKEWLRVRGRRGFDPAAQGFGLDAPRGVLLTGVPGCGKSLIAETLARAWNLPLVLLDPGASTDRSSASRSHGCDGRSARSKPWPRSCCGSTRSRRVSPPDSVEATVARAMRVLGSFLRWLQDRPEGSSSSRPATTSTSCLPSCFARGGSTRPSSWISPMTKSAGLCWGCICADVGATRPRSISRTPLPSRMVSRAPSSKVSSSPRCTERSRSTAT
ncbi:MAG TPA: hypothetical protein VNC60_08985 [Actinomycetota bacterium]|nr:hypothetical protein [Actinomycetota bacterium]